MARPAEALASQRANYHLASIEALGVDIAAFSAMPNESEVMALTMPQVTSCFAHIENLLHFLQFALGSALAVL